MHFGHDAGAMTIFEGFPFIVGGYYGTRITAVAERFNATHDQKTREWKLVQRMPNAVQGLSIIALEERLYTFGKPYMI